jgi:hypothetical protein
MELSNYSCETPSYNDFAGRRVFCRGDINGFFQLDEHTT